MHEYDVTFKIFGGTITRREKGYSLQAVKKRVNEMSVNDVLADLTVEDAGGVFAVSMTEESIARLDKKK